MTHANHRDQLGRLRRIEGQIRGIIRMVEEERYCVDILTQLRALRAAVRGVEARVLRDHVDHCVSAAVRGGRRDRRDAKIDELLSVLERYAE